MAFYVATNVIIKNFVPILPDYVVDFSYTILGTVRQQTIHIRNPISSSITFRLERFAYKNTGFSFDCDHVKNLPPGEIISIIVTFDPRGANLELGPVECRVPVEVRNHLTNLLFRLMIRLIEISLICNCLC